MKLRTKSGRRNCLVYLLVPFFLQLPGSMAQPCIVDGVDINTCDDDFKLNELVSYFWSFFPSVFQEATLDLS